MKQMLDIFEELKISDLQIRRRLFAKACENSDVEILLFIVAAYDYVFNPTDKKAAAFEQLFLPENAPQSVNLRATHRRKALAMIGNPKLKLNYECLVGNDCNAHRPKLNKFVRTAGVSGSGAANYNLTTKSLNIAVPNLQGLGVYQTYMRENDLSAGTKINLRGQNGVRQLKKYWGDGIAHLGLN